jgi:hypothetical protein
VKVIYAALVLFTCGIVVITGESAIAGAISDAGLTGVTAILLAAALPGSLIAYALA